MLLNELVIRAIRIAEVYADLVRGQRPRPDIYINIGPVIETSLFVIDVTLCLVHKSDYDWHIASMVNKWYDTDELEGECKLDYAAAADMWETLKSIGMKKNITLSTREVWNEN